MGVLFLPNGHSASPSRENFRTAIKRESIVAGLRITDRIRSDELIMTGTMAGTMAAVAIYRMQESIIK